MIRYIFPLTFLAFAVLMSFRLQTGNAPGYGPVDTLAFYRVSTSATTDKKGNRIYKVNNEVVTQATYDKYNAGYDNVSNCKPCWMRTYDRDGKLLSEGMQYTDCLVGDFREYYPDGKLKSAGHYLENHTGNWNNAYKRGYCGTKDGEWKYYSTSGADSATQAYVKGKPVTTSK